MSEQQSDDFFVPEFFLNLPSAEDEAHARNAGAAENFLQDVESWTENYLLDDLPD